MRIVQDAYTFDDVLLLPAYSSVLPRDVTTQTALTREIQLNIPLVSAAMDTVTEAELAIALAQEGGLGVIHKNMTIEQQAAQVAKVKKFESGVIADPFTVSPKATIGEVLDLTREKNISALPVIDNGQLVGIVTSRDLKFERRYTDPVSKVMTPQDRLITVKEGAERDHILKLLHQHRIERLLVVGKGFSLKGMITVKDIEKSKENPQACKDAHQRLRVGAALGTGDENRQRVDALFNVGVDVVVVDTAHGHSKGVLEQISWIKKHYPDLQVIGGNIATGDAAIALVKAGADGVKVGIGPGSICTTRLIAGVGVPQITAIDNVATALEGTGVPLIADGGIRYSGDMAKAIVAGAHSIMIGSLLAGTTEAPGAVEHFQGRAYKSYRGMGSLGAMSAQSGSKDRYFQQDTKEVDKLVPEGVEGRVPLKGSMQSIIHQLIGGLRSSMGYTGCADLTAMRTQPEFVKVTNAGMRESHVHDVTITKEAPNYRV
jgi:IMP dehydrogenase